MRIAMISKALVVGAYQRKLEELARLPGVELTAIVPPLWRDSRGEARLERVFTEGYQLVETPITLNGHFHAHFYPRLAADLDQIQPDLVHVDEEPYNLAAWQAVRWAVRCRRPALFFTWQNLFRRYPPPFSWIEQYNYSRAAHAIAGNHEAADVLRSKGYAGPISIIPQFGIDPELYQPAARAPLAARPQDAVLVVGYAGGLVPEKGLDTLLNALAIGNQQLAAAGGSAGACHLQLAGVGPQGPDLVLLAGQLGLAGQVAFLGRISSVDMPAFYAGIDVLVLPSRTTPSWKEQFGRVLIEAMASGLPVVGSDSGEIPNVIGDAGWVFREGDAGALAGLLLRLAASPDLRVELGRQGRQRVLARYTQEQIALDTFGVYQQMLGG